MDIFVDYASVDANQPPDWVKLKTAASGAGSTLTGVIFRAAYGTWPDPVLARDWRAARAAGLVAGAYLYLRMSDLHMDPEDQVHALANNLGVITDQDMVPTIDVEDTGMAPADELEWVHRAWQAVHDIYGVAPMIYTSARVWTEDLDGLPNADLVKSPLWLAKPWPWAVQTRAQLSPGPFLGGKYAPAVPRPWGAGNWWLHQYQGDAKPVPGVTNTMDLSRFNPMGQGERGERVAWVQARVGATPDGSFGPVTAAALRRFQADHSLPATAVVDPKTFVALMWARPASAA
jgi:GH25 family lysozyme M1 (1,4-beta-N-acetylmuramidase)